LHVWWTVLSTWAVVTFGWFVMYQVVEGVANAVRPGITSGIGLQTVAGIEFMWHWFPIEFLLGMLVWAYVQSQKRDPESFYTG